MTTSVGNNILPISNFKIPFLKILKKIDFFVEDWNSGQRSEESRGMVVVQNARLIYPLKMRGLTLKVNFNTQGQISWSTFGSELDLEGQSTHFHRVNGARILYYSWWMLFFSTDSFAWLISKRQEVQLLKPKLQSIWSGCGMIPDDEEWNYETKTRQKLSKQ